MSSFVGLHTALSGLRAGQAGLDTATHNVANAHTPGYTRQRLDLQTRNPYFSPVGPVGTGVDVQGISRVRDAFLDARVRAVSAEFASSDTNAQLLRRAESVLGEPDTGLTAPLGAIWDSFEDLAMDPAEGASRQQVISALEAFTARVRGVAGGWDQLAVDTTRRLDGTVQEVNDLLTQVADLNRRIGDVSLRAGTPNDLLDQRDLAIDRLAAALGATVTTGTDGMVKVELPTTDGATVALVEGATARALSLAGEQVRVDVDGAPVAVRSGGEVGAMQTFLSRTLPERHAALDALMADLAGALNAQHAAGYDAEGNPGGDLLTFDAATGAARSLRVPADLAADPRRIAAASAEPVATHDGRNAEALAALRTARADGQATFDGRLDAFVVDLASRVSTAGAAADAQASLSMAAANARSQTHAVSLDEEMVGVVAYQRMLEAASRVMTAVDQSLDVLINRTGIVGR